MKATVYVESSVISYLTARSSRDVVKSARQAITVEWWENSQSEFELFISTLVREEISHGDPIAAEQRMKIVQNIKVLSTHDKAESIAHALIAACALPEKSKEDALHIGIAASQGMDYLLTWNFKHINNAQKTSAIIDVVQNFGFTCPILCSPEELGAYS
ncbi:hypothetical protein PN36_01375 [Candidatus Thiomargarita nelsonii]|uniref:PIN domain-containing protein n=1 Tax=Candidatus Thiomargarita nelsonii TaxID=1003181 RepID=A0A0A6RLP2_9GAMM|nr:hypothetical protein PN36_01375 [Candidatus Thiomargarita nelsonii]